MNHEDTIDDFIRKNPGYERHGLRKKINDKYEKDYYKWLVNEASLPPDEQEIPDACKKLEEYKKVRHKGGGEKLFHGNLGFIPDAFKVEWFEFGGDYDMPRVHLVEVVDTHGISKYKMETILSFWLALDDICPGTCTLQIIDVTTGTDQLIDSEGLEQLYLRQQLQ